jgi:glycosyltransferase involved in cell wall biosynthesis
VGSSTKSAKDLVASLSPKLSVVMCVRNGEPYIQEAVESILQQTFRDFEFLIVDDHSTDGTLRYLQSLSDPRVRVLRASAEGQTPGLNQGLKGAKADWIARMDGDDWSFPERLQKEWEAAAKTSEAVLVSSDYWLCDEALEPVAPIRLTPDSEAVLRFLRTKNNPFCHPVMMFHRKTALSVGGFDETLKNAQDYGLWLRLSEKGKLIHVEALLLKYRVRRASLSILRQPEQTRERRTLLGKEKKSLALDQTSLQSDRAVEGMYMYRLAFGAWLAGKSRLARHYSLRSLTCGVRPLRSAFVFITSILPRAIYLRINGYHRVFR